MRQAGRVEFKGRVERRSCTLAIPGYFEQTQQASPGNVWTTLGAQGGARKPSHEDADRRVDIQS
jgi:hypothetical protein